VTVNEDIKALTSAPGQSEEAKREIGYLLRERERKLSLVLKAITENPGSVSGVLYWALKQTPDFQYLTLKTFENYLWTLYAEHKIRVGPGGIYPEPEEAGRPDRIYGSEEERREQEAEGE